MVHAFSFFGNTGLKNTEGYQLIDWCNWRPREKIEERQEGEEATDKPRFTAQEMAMDALGLRRHC